MADDRPLLNPVLRLKMDGRPEPQTGGGKGRASVVVERLAEQQRVLSAAARNLYRDRERLPTYGGRTHLLVRMFAEDSLAPSHTPDDLFSYVTGCQLVAPYRQGYVVEAEIAVLPRLTAAIENQLRGAIGHLARVDGRGIFHRRPAAPSLRRATLERRPCRR